MALKHLGYVDLPLHVGSGGFDHAAVYQAKAAGRDRVELFTRRAPR